jgi:3-mercaptopyruvate sulfurtransferase SseA
MGLVPEVMISPATLHNWLTTGYGFDTYGYRRMVILDVDSRAGYDRGHIPGAMLLENSSNDLWARRTNGFTETPYQVATRSQMDNIIRRTSIDTDAVVVFTGSDMMYVARAYFNFRYWGFPRQKLKVLNTTKELYKAAGYVLQTKPVPAPEPCEFSVCSLQQQNSVHAMRASFQEMITVAGDDDPSTVILDTRSSDEFAGKAGSTSLAMEENGYVVFEGHIRTALHLDNNIVLDALSDPDMNRAKARMSGALEKTGLNDTGTAFLYNRTGLAATGAFLALDGLLNLPVKIYDGGWIQWGQMAATNAATGGTLAADSPWRTDIPSRSAAITYNKPNGFTINTGGHYNSYAKRADVINQHDAAACSETAGHRAPVPPAPGY